MKPFALFTALALMAGSASAQQRSALGVFDAEADVGTTAHAGSTALDAGAYRVTGGGANIWGGEDAFHYVWTRRSGDLHIAADIAFDPASAASDPHRKAGVMIRQNPRRARLMPT